MIDDIILLVKSAIGKSVYLDVVPENAPLPAVAVSNVTNTHSRSLSGEKYGKVKYWRVTIIAKSSSDLVSMTESILQLDNTKNLDFQRIFADLVQYEEKEQDQPVRRSFVDLTLY